MPGMTDISRQMAQKAVRIRSTEEAVSFLKNNPPFRTLKDILIAADKQRMTEAELKRRITDGFCAHHPQKKRDSVERNIRNWFSGRTRSLSREDAFELCLILGLSLDEANRFMMRITDEAIHWRNPEEIVWGYAIVHRLSYDETIALQERARKATALKDGERKRQTHIHTHIVRDEVLTRIRGTQDELIAYLEEHAQLWGSLHNEAYDLFMRFEQLLETATYTQEEYERKKEELEAEKKTGSLGEGAMDFKLPVETILDTYYFRRCIKSDTRYDGIQKSIRANWPDETTLSKMRNRSGNTDVSRKVLIMLFLATNGDGTAYRADDDDDFDEKKTRDQVFRSLYIRLNQMLGRCGFQPLDPRSPFDWLILYCICVEDVCETDEKLGSVLAELFAPIEGETEQGNEKQPG